MAVAIKKITRIARSAHQIADDPLMSDANLQGYWKLENVNDSSSNGYNLTNNGTVTFPVGRFNNGANFVAASSQYLNIADASAANLEITGSRTVSFWFKPVDKTGTYTVFAHDDTTNGWIIYQNSWNYQFLIRGLTINTYINSSPSDGAPGTVVVGQWQHVVGVYDSANSKLKIWFNGLKTELTASGSSTNSAADFSIGARDKGATVDLYASGMIDDLAIWNRALTDIELSRLYNGNIKKIGGKTMAQVKKFMGVSNA